MDEEDERRELMGDMVMKVEEREDERMEGERSPVGRREGNCHFSCLMVTDSLKV